MWTCPKYTNLPSEVSAELLNKLPYRIKTMQNYMTLKHNLSPLLLSELFYPIEEFLHHDVISYHLNTFSDSDIICFITINMHRIYCFRLCFDVTDFIPLIWSLDNRMQCNHLISVDRSLSMYTIFIAFIVFYVNLIMTMSIEVTFVHGYRRQINR